MGVKQDKPMPGSEAALTAELNRYKQAMTDNMEHTIRPLVARVAELEAGNRQKDMVIKSLREQLANIEKENIEAMAEQSRHFHAKLAEVEKELERTQEDRAQAAVDADREWKRAEAAEKVVEAAEKLSVARGPYLCECDMTGFCRACLMRAAIAAYKGRGNK